MSLIRRSIRSGRQTGFTMIELMVVIVIIGVLATLAVQNFIGRDDEAKVTAARSDIATLSSALKLYRLDNGVYPSKEQGLQALVTKPTTGNIPANWRRPYLDKLPLDPWKNPYQYDNPGKHGEVDIYSLGSDGQPGGEAFAADIGSWQ